MKKRWKAGILAAILLILFASNWALSAWNDRQEEREAQEAEEARIALTDAEEVIAFSYSNGEDEMAFSNVDGTWQYDADTEIPMDQDSLQEAADFVGQWEAVRKLEDPDALEDYGLEDPLYTVDFMDADGTETIVYIGNGTGENYYAAVESQNEVYTISCDFQNYLLFDLDELAKLDTVPSIGSGNLKKVTVTEAGEETSYDEEEDLAELAGGFGTLTLTDCVDYHVDEAGLESYGLDEGSRTVVLAAYTDSDTEEDAEFCIYVGTLDDTGENRYVMVEGSKLVYLVSDSVIQNLMTVEEADE